MKKFLKIALVIVVVLLLLPVLYATFRPNLIVPKAEVKAKFTLPTSHFIMWRGSEIHYTDEGQGSPVLMIHGFGGSFRNWNKLNDLMKENHRVIRVDLPGFGMSDLPEPDGANTDFVQEYQDFMTFFLDTIHVDSLTLIGNSMGGMVSWNATADHPEKVKKLVLLGSAGYELNEIANKVAFFMRLPMTEYFFKKGMSLSSSEGAARSVYADDSKIDHESVKGNNMMWNREGNIHAAIALVSNKRLPDSTLICKIKCPTLILWGKQDEIVPLRHAYKFQRDIAGSQLVLFDTCGHVPMMEKPKETRAVIEKFLSE